MFDKMKRFFGHTEIADFLIATIEAGEWGYDDTYGIRVHDHTWVYPMKELRLSYGGIFTFEPLWFSECELSYFERVRVRRTCKKFIKESRQRKRITKRLRFEADVKNGSI